MTKTLEEFTNDKTDDIKWNFRKKLNLNSITEKIEEFEKKKEISSDEEIFEAFFVDKKYYEIRYFDKKGRSIEKKYAKFYKVEEYDLVENEKVRRFLGETIGKIENLDIEKLKKGYYRRTEYNGQSFEDKYAGKSYFPYVAPYSQSNTGFTPAPEINDRVALYFPNGNETHAIVLGAVNNDGNGRFTDVANRNYHVGDSDFNMVLATNSLSTMAASSISQTASSISESADSISESAGNINNIANSYSEIIKNEKAILAKNIVQVAQENIDMQSNGDTIVNSDGFSVVNGGANVFINKS